MVERVVPVGEVRPGFGGHHALVLAGGDGRRLAGVAERKYGYARPKQYCSFGPGGTLIEQTLRRALLFAGDPSRIVVSTARAHRRESDECLASWPGVSRVEQPRNLDTTPGIALPLIEILVRDPWATVLVLPCDHWISDDERFVQALTDAARGFEDDPNAILLAGAVLDEPEPDLGWIVPAPATTDAPWQRVLRFVEKPSTADTRALHESGAFANTFALLARGTALASLIRRHAPDWWNGIVNAYFRPDAIERLYERMPASSLSREVLARAPGQLGVVPLPGVGWSDIGTPERLDRVIAPRPLPAAAAAAIAAA